MATWRHNPDRRLQELLHRESADNEIQFVTKLHSKVSLLRPPQRVNQDFVPTTRRRHSGDSGNAPCPIGMRPHRRFSWCHRSIGFIQFPFDTRYKIWIFVSSMQRGIYYLQNPLNASQRKNPRGGRRWRNHVIECDRIHPGWDEEIEINCISSPPS